MSGVIHDEATSGEEPVRKRQKKNTPLACRTCREKRTKCDGQVTCKVCQIYDRECIYDRDKDGRRPARKDYVAALEERVRQLEGGTVDRGSPSAHASVSPQTNILMGQMKASGDGSTVHYGPTSSYMHLEEPTGTTEQPICPVNTAASLATFDWRIDWKRSLPQHPCLTVELHATLISIFLSYANGWCYWLDEQSFLNGLQGSAMSDRPLRNHDYSPFLHNVILAFGCLSMAKNDLYYPSGQILGPLFAQTASRMIDGELAAPLTTTSRGLMLLGSYHFFNSQRNLGWMTAGMGARVGQILGLNISSNGLLENGSISAQSYEHRVHVFWTGFIQDVFMNLNVGRRPALSISDFNIDLPTINADRDLDSWRDHRKRLHPDTPAEPGWLSTTLHWSAKLAMIASDVYHSIYSVRGHDIDKTEQARIRIELDLAGWLAGCPIVLQPEYWQGREMPPHIIAVLAAAHHVRILLHRPTCYAYQTFDEAHRSKAVEVCLSAARHILRLVSLSTSRQNTCYILSNALFAAGTTFLMVSTRNESSKQTVEKATIDSGECIRLMLDFPTSASQVGHDIMQKLCKEWDAPKIPTETILKKDETIKLLSDANSDMVKLLTELGWQRPVTPAPVVDSVTDNIGLSDFLSGDNFGTMTSNPMNIETYDPLGWPSWFMNDISDSGSWPN